MSTTTASSERRSSFRIHQDVMFDFRVVDKTTAEQAPPEQALEDSASLGLLTELRRIDRDNQQVLKLIGEKHKLLADYLHKLNQKVDLIARHSLFAQNSQHQTQRLNLSEEGVAFESPRALYKGNFLVVRLIFLPSYTPVISFASVIRCEAKDSRATDATPNTKAQQTADQNRADAGYRVAARFHRLQDQDRQELARQILRAQVYQRKKGTTPESRP